MLNSWSIKQFGRIVAFYKWDELSPNPVKQNHLFSDSGRGSNVDCSLQWVHDWNRHGSHCSACFHIWNPSFDHTLQSGSYRGRGLRADEKERGQTNSQANSCSLASHHSSRCYSLCRINVCSQGVCIEKKNKSRTMFIIPRPPDTHCLVYPHPRNVSTFYSRRKIIYQWENFTWL